MSKTTALPVLTADGRAHRSASCKRAVGKDVLTALPAVLHVKACTYCKPSDQAQQDAYEALLGADRPADSYETDVPAAESSYMGDRVDQDAVETLGATDAADALREACEARDSEQALTGLGTAMRTERRGGATVAELALKYGMSAKEARVILQGTVPDPKPTAPAAARGKVSKSLQTLQKRSATSARKASTDTATKAPRTRATGLPEVTVADLDVMLALRAEGASWRKVEAAVPHLRRSSSPLRKIVLAEAARRGVSA